MAALRILVSADTQANQPSSTLQAIVNYSRIVRAGGENENGEKLPDEIGPRQKQFPLPQAVAGDLRIDDYAANTTLSLAVADIKGLILLPFKELMPEFERRIGEWRAELSISADEMRRLIDATTPNNPETTSVISAKAEFKPTIDINVNFRKYSLVVSPVEKGALPEDKLQAYFGQSAGTAVSSEIAVGPSTFLSDFVVNSVQTVDLSIQGRFDFTVPRLPADDAWLWVLHGPETFAGLVSDIRDALGFRRVLWLPFERAEEPEGAAGNTDHGAGKPAPPVDPSEQELINDPQLFTDDPGTKCKPFSSPNRIVGEKSFQTILRVSQPEISTDPAAPRPPRAMDLMDHYNVDSSELVLAAATEPPARPAPSRSSPVSRGVSGLDSSVLGNLSEIRNAVTSVRGATAGTAMTPEAELVAEERADILKNAEGRHVLSGRKSLDWEDNTPPQSASLAYGHSLEYRVRWRNNGYSLGTVLYSLALAPRQTKQIVTVTSQIIDRARRAETTTASEEVAQATTRDYQYADAVEATLSEWAKGGSTSKTTGGAGGFGLAIGPVVVGGGASHGRADSSSWKEGGRKVTAHEEQSLRDAIRQYGDSLRQLNSVVVHELSQEETVQAVSETVRNPNYCHSLTVVYHEILRHMRVDTEVVGARECIFVPLPIKPFTWSRMIRWRDSLTAVLMRPSLRWIMPYLEDVETNFSTSEIPEGRRADQPIKYVLGSIYLQIAIERPQDNDDDVFEQAKWVGLSPYVNRPIREIFDRLKRNKSQRDQIYQKEYAPGIAAKWIDKLTIKGGGATFSGVDMTMATRYAYNRTVRVDFTYTPETVIRRSDLQLLTITVDNEASLPPGSVANVQTLKLRYYTNDFEREQTSARAAHDLINVENGLPDPAGADLLLPLDEWEKKNQRAFIRAEALKLRKHLNEHMEHYHKHIWWMMDRDKLYMLLDTVYALSADDGRSVASVVERNPIAILGNSLVYKVAGGAHLGIDGHKTSAELNAYYADSVGRSEPIRISLPTSGVYAQALLDDCEACEEHFGGTEWILTDKEPELAALDPSMLGSRRAAAPDLKPSDFPASIINLQNAATPPAPSGFAGALEALTKADAFGDMTGLAGTQANARAAMESAAQLATSFGTQAAEIRKAEIAARVAKEKLAVVKKAKDTGAVPDDKAAKVSGDILKDMANNGPSPEETLNAEEIDKVAKTSDEKDVDIDVDQKKKTVKIRKTGKPVTKKGEVKTNVTIIARDIDGQPLSGSFLISIGPISHEKVDIDDLKPVVNFSGIVIDASKPVVFRMIGDPVVTPGGDLIAIGPEFFHNAIDVVAVNKGENIVLFVQQVRKKVIATFDQQVSESKLKEWVIAGEIGAETGAIAQLLAGKLSAKIKGSYKGATTETEGAAIRHQYEVIYPDRMLKVKQQGQESTFIDPDL